MLSQSFEDWELIIVDDGSTDNTRNLIARLKDSRIKYYYQAHGERSKARNLGIKKSIGLFLSFLDDDDYYLPGFLESIHEFIHANGNPVAFFMCRENVEYDSGETESYEVPEKYLNNPVRLLWEMQSSIRPFCIHRNIFLEFNFREDCNYGEDFDLIIRIALSYPYYYLNKVLMINVNHKFQGTKTKFEHLLELNAMNSIACIENLVKENKSQLYKKIPKSIVFNSINRIVYAFASGAMKKGDSRLFLRMLARIDIKGVKFKIIYYYLSLLIRYPFYFIKHKFNNPS